MKDARWQISPVGLSQKDKRWQAAVAAMQSMLYGEIDWDDKRVAKLAFKVASAMLAEEAQQDQV